MPEYLAPGVFVEEVSFRPQSIEGVSTSTTGFVGPTRFGPIYGEPPLLTSFRDFETIYGGLDLLHFSGEPTPSQNYLAHAVRAYFEEGGVRLYVARTYDLVDGFAEPSFGATGWSGALSSGRWEDGIARWPQTSGTPASNFGFRARYPGAAADVTVRLVFRRGENILDTSDFTPQLRGAAPFDTVLAAAAGADPVAYWLERYFDEGQQRDTFQLRRGTTSVALTQVSEVRILTVSVLMAPMGRFSEEVAWENLTFDPRHNRSLSQVFAPRPTRRSAELNVPLVFGTIATDGAAIADALLDQPNRRSSGNIRDGLGTVIGSPEVPTTEEDRTFSIELAGGNDGTRPDPGDYEGDERADGQKSGLLAFEDLEDISIVAVPGSTRGYLNGYEAQARSIGNSLITHCERMRYRVAVLDSGDGFTLADVREQKSRIDSTRAALYYPWVQILDPVTETEIFLPPSGFVAGIYARTDIERGVHKAPANEVVRLALGFELLINKAQQETLNPDGINCLRFFEGRGFRVWGARTTSSNAEWRYLNVRRYFAFLERSIERGTQFAVFEPNGPVLWANVQRTVSDFLFNEWSLNHLLGARPEEAFFVRCDRTTMTQNDLDNGRLVCLIGVAPLRPAEFVIFRIGQKTADARG